ncbi:MAG: hypothetical protein ACOZAL_01750 [Patescibacteria group bacterium]
MPSLIFKIQPTKEHGRSPVEIVLRDKNKIFKSITENTDNLLSTLDKLLKRNKIELETLNDIKVEISKKAGFTSQRIVKAIVKALSLNL